MKRIFVAAVGMVTLFLLSCGRGPFHITSPNEGQRFTIPQQGSYPQQGQNNQFQITLDNQDAYDDVTITLQGQEALPAGVLQCVPWQGGPTTCYINAPQVYTGINQSYTVLIKAVRGDYQDTRLIYFDPPGIRR